MNMEIFLAGLFYVHLLRAFMQLQVDKIHVRYIPKWYTRFARKDLEFDRCDLRLVGEDGNTQSYRTTLLVTKAMQVVRAGNMSGQACERALEGLDALCKELQQIPPDIGPSSRKKGKSHASVVDDGNLGSWSWQVSKNCGETFDLKEMTSNLEFKNRYELCCRLGMTFWIMRRMG
jgi:hypothetical protein